MHALQSAYDRAAVHLVAAATGRPPMLPDGIHSFYVNYISEAHILTDSAGGNMRGASFAFCSSSRGKEEERRSRPCSNELSIGPSH